MNTSSEPQQKKSGISALLLNSFLVLSFWGIDVKRFFCKATPA